MSNRVYLIEINGRTGTRHEVVKPIRERGNKTLVLHLEGATVKQTWVRTSRIQVRA